MTLRIRIVEDAGEGREPGPPGELKPERHDPSVAREADREVAGAQAHGPRLPTSRPRWRGRASRARVRLQEEGHRGVSGFRSGNRSTPRLARSASDERVQQGVAGPHGQDRRRAHGQTRRAGRIASRREAIEELLGRARLEGDRIEVERVEQEGARHQFVEREAAPAVGARGQILGQAPAGIEGTPVDRDGAAADQGFEAGQRGHRLDVVGPVEQIDDGEPTDDPVGERRAPRPPELRRSGTRPPRRDAACRAGTRPGCWLAPPAADRGSSAPPASRASRRRRPRPGRGRGRSGDPGGQSPGVVGETDIVLGQAAGDHESRAGPSRARRGPAERSTSAGEARAGSRSADRSRSRDRRRRSRRPGARPAPRPTERRKPSSIRARGTPASAQSGPSRSGIRVAQTRTWA